MTHQQPHSSPCQRPPLLAPQLLPASHISVWRLLLNSLRLGSLQSLPAWPWTACQAGVLSASGPRGNQLSQRP